MGASSRLRSLQFVPYLKRYGFRITHSSLFDDAYLQNLYSTGKRYFSSMLGAYLRRMRALCESGSFDLLWIEKEALPYLPYGFESLLMPRGVPYVVDYDDAVFHNYDKSDFGLVRAVLGHKIDSVMVGASTVICGNDYLAARARQAGASRIEHVPTVVDSGRYGENANVGGGDDKAVPVIGWIGSPSTERYVLDLQSVLASVCEGTGARLMLVGARPEFAQRCESLPIEVVPWSEDTEADYIARFDIGIMPLPDEPWERGKCGYKLIQYMASNKPVVASPVGVNKQIVREWDCGLLASDDAQWREALTLLITNESLRRRLGHQGRYAVETHYSTCVQVPRIARILRAAANAH
ncbi:MAG: glycosyl transferase family 1 [Salinisphaera sp.]|nr:glycosyl transferase family 1 [Salinisphaera sp.]